jgi:hypothetical protein
VKQQEEEFAEWLCDILKEWNIQEKAFPVDFFLDSYVGIESILTICSTGWEEWLDYGAIDSITAFFRRCYNGGNRNLFVFPSDIRMIDLSGAREAQKCIRDGQAMMVYTFIDMKDHWGVACLNLTKYEICLGDPLERPFPMDEIDKLIRCIQHCEGDEGNFEQAKWEQAKKNIGRFDVPNLEVSGSCGILAAVAIERAVNEYARGAEVSAERQRIRFLRLLTGNAKVSYFL